MDMSVCMHDVQIHIYSCIDNQSEINGFKFGDHLHSFDIRCYLVLRVDHPTYETVLPSPYTHTRSRDVGWSAAVCQSCSCCISGQAAR